MHRYSRHIRAFLRRVVLIACLPAVATAEPAATIAAGPMTIELLGGLALFLYGIDQMTTGLRAVAGDRMKLVLARLTSNRFTGALTGAVVTAIIQSSSVTTVLVVGFTTAGLMSFSQAIGVIMGANIGTTVTAQIVAFKITKAALGMIAAGFAFLFFSKRNTIRHYGGILMGLGLVFFGMTVMSGAMEPLRSYQPFLDLMVRMENPAVGILVAMLFTALIQSSSATTAIVVVLAGQGFISLPAGIALALGANVGTCVTALLASIGKPREAIRAATTHVLFNVGGVLLWVGLIDQLAWLATAISPVHEELAGKARLAAEAPRQIANAHTVFNVANTAIFIGFTTVIARFVEWLVPDRPLALEADVRPLFLDQDLLKTPALALEQVRHEINHMGEQVKEMLSRIMPAILAGSPAALYEIRGIDERVDALHAEIVTYLGKISGRELTPVQTETFLRLMDAANDLENIGDVIEMNLVELGINRINKGVSISAPTQKVLRGFHDVVSRAVENAIHAVSENSPEAAESVTSMKKEITAIVNSAALHEAKRLVVNEPHRIEAYTIEMDIAEKLQRIYFFARRMARTVRASESAAQPEGQ
jgi:phosphate:Na+ symporter